MKNRTSLYLPSTAGAPIDSSISVDRNAGLVDSSSDPVRTFEDPLLVGEEAARQAHLQRLYREMCRRGEEPPRLGDSPDW